MISMKQERMRMNSKVILIVATLALTVSCAAKDIQSDPPGGIRLLPGYQHRRLQSIDDMIGEIWKDGGLKIHYDIGAWANDPDNCKTCEVRVLWRQEQVVNGQRVVCALYQTKLLIINIDGHASFEATIKTQQQQADMLLMVLTFHKMSR